MMNSNLDRITDKIERNKILPAYIKRCEQQLDFFCVVGHEYIKAFVIQNIVLITLMEGLNDDESKELEEYFINRVYEYTAYDLETLKVLNQL